jgi:2-dehydropantoate 2-reductase
MMRIALLGTGALGTLFGVRLAGVAEVWMLGTWREALEAARRHGLRLITPQGEETAFVAAAEDPAEVPPCDAALILVKAYQTERAARWARQVLKPAGIALTLQNGLGPYETLRTVLGPERAWQGVTMMGATLEAPGRARLGGEGPIWLGAPSSSRAPLEPLLARLRQAGFAVEIREDLRGVIWGKLVANTAINPVTALFDVPNGALLEPAGAVGPGPGDGSGDGRGGPRPGDPAALRGPRRLRGRGLPADRGELLVDATGRAAGPPDGDRRPERGGGGHRTGTGDPCPPQ